MIYTDNTRKAIKMCFEKHKNQVDKSGMPYVFHPFHLAEQMQSEDTIIVALLHDVMEDTDTKIEEIADLGFSKEVLEALDVMNHRDGVPYFEYIKLISNNPIARKVKIADLIHNSDLSRLPQVTEKDLKRLEKYQYSLNILNEIENRKIETDFKKGV